MDNNCYHNCSITVISMWVWTLYKKSQILRVNFCDHILRRLSLYAKENNVLYQYGGGITALDKQPIQNKHHWLIYWAFFLCVANQICYAVAWSGENQKKKRDFNSSTNSNTMLPGTFTILESAEKP